MEPPDDKQHPERRESEPPRGEEKARDDGPSAGPPAIETSDPLVRSGPAAYSQNLGDPDRIMIIETNRIREPDAASTPHFVAVPVEFDRPAPGRSGAGSEGG